MHFNILTCFILLVTTFKTVVMKDIVDQVLFVVLSQPNSYHVNRAEHFRKQFQAQVQLQNSKPDLYLLHEQWPDLLGGWTILPLLTKIAKEVKNKSWVYFCEEDTEVNVQKLLENLVKYDETEDIYLGKGLEDKNRVIIHHFRRIEKEHGFTYPDFAAGFAITFKLIQKIVNRMEEEIPDINFAIDPKHEIAYYIFDNGKGPVMKNVSFLCTTEVDDECATSLPNKFPQCGEAISADELFIAVKTCEKYHKVRLPIINKLWTGDAKHIEFYSETADPEFSTIDLGVENTESGHCGKLQGILQRAYNTDYIRSKPWLVITDDDTLMSVPRLRRLLACYNPSEPVALGEKYGYSLLKGGYDYITGGGGMVLSMEAVKRLVECKSCVCRQNSSPDDMMLGVWLKRLQIPVTHSPLFHQARAAEYAEEYLSRQLPVSFHKFWENNPEKDYAKYLKDDLRRDEL